MGISNKNTISIFCIIHVICYVKLKTCLHIRMHYWHTDNSVLSVLTETRLARNESYAFEYCKVCLNTYRYTKPTFISRSA